MGDRPVAPKTMKKMLDVSLKQAYRLIEERHTKKGILPPTIPYTRVQCFGKPDQKEVLLSNIARYLVDSLPVKKSDHKREDRRIKHQDKTLNELKEILGNAFPA